VHRLTEALAEELKDAGVTVNAVLPSIIDRVQNRATCRRRTSPLGRARDLAEVMLFLTSEKREP